MLLPVLFLVLASGTIKTLETINYYASGMIPSSRLAQLVERVTSTMQSFNDEVSRSSRLVGIAAPSRLAFYFFYLLQSCTRSSIGYRQGHTIRVIVRR